MGIKTASRLPHLALLAVCVVSLGARCAWIGLPCHRTCRGPAAHLLIFDERYYVNAARVLAGLRPPDVSGSAYRDAPGGSDPNAEHPQLAKLVMAGSIELFGDGPWGWRTGSLLFGTLAILGMFALVRGAGGGPWLAVGAAGLMAADNLLLVDGRIGTLEIYVVAAMIWSLALYLRGHPVLAGVVAGIGACMKLFALDMVVMLALVEVIGAGPAAADVRRRLIRLARALGGLVASFIGLLAILDEIAPPYDNTAGRFLSGGPFGHLAHMISYGAHQVGLAAGNGIASYPWEWLGDYKPIQYLTLNPAQPDGFRGDHPQVHFLGLVSPPILLVGLLGTGLALWWTPQSLRTAASRPGTTSPRLVGRPAGRPAITPRDGELLKLSAAWFLGTFGPFLLASVAFGRTTYLYYVTIVMPGMYLAGAWLVSRMRGRRWLFWPWMVSVAAAFVLLYPFTPLF